MCNFLMIGLDEFDEEVSEDVLADAGLWFISGVADGLELIEISFEYCLYKLCIGVVDVGCKVVLKCGPYG